MFKYNKTVSSDLLGLISKTRATMLTNTSYKITIILSIYINYITQYIQYSHSTFIDNFEHVFINPAHIYLFKVNTKNTRKRCDECSMIT